MEITSFKPSGDRTKLEIELSGAAGATSMLLFTDKTYKDYSKALILTDKLTGADQQSIEISLAELKQPYLDGLYFVQVETAEKVYTRITLDDTRYKECVVEKVQQASHHKEGLRNVSESTIGVEMLSNALRMACEIGFVNEAFNILAMLNTLCGTKCKSCGQSSTN